MNKFLKILVVIFLLLLIVAGIFGVRAWQLHHDATLYIQLNLPSILAHWNGQELIDRASPELLAVTPKEKIAQMFASFEQLGAVRSVGEPIGRVVTQASANGPSGTFGVYLIKVEFERGQVEIKMTLKQYQQTWRIQEFYVSAPTLPELSPPRETTV